MTLVLLSMRMDMLSWLSRNEREDEELVDAPVGAGEHVGPSFGIGRELDFQVVGIVVDDFIDMARIAPQRAAHQDQRVAAPASRGRRRRGIVERIVPEQYVEPIVAVIGEHGVGSESLLAITHLARVLDQIEAVEVDASDDLGSRRPDAGPARRMY